TLDTGRRGRLDLELARRGPVVLLLANVQAELVDDTAALVGVGPDVPHRVRRLVLVRRDDLDQRHVDRLANAATRALRVEIFEPDRETQLRQRQHRGERRLATSLAQPTDAVAVQPLAVFVDGVPPEQELDLVVGELEALPGPLTARLPEVLRCGPHHFPAERQFRQPIGEGDQPVSWRYRSALLLG